MVDFGFELTTHLLPSSPVLPERRSVEVPTSDRHLLLTGRTATGFSRVSWIFSVSWRIRRDSPSQSAYSTFSRRISTSSLCPRYVTGKRRIAFSSGARRGQNDNVPSSSRMPPNPYVSVIQVPPIEAIWQPSFTFPPTSAKSISSAAIPYRTALSISPICAAMIASTDDDNDESPVVRGS